MKKPITNEYLANLFEASYSVEKLSNGDNVFLIESKKMDIIVQGKTLEEAAERYYKTIVGNIMLLTHDNRISILPK